MVRGAGAERVLEQVMRRSRREVDGNEVHERGFLPWNHWRQALVQQAQRVVHGVETAYRTRARVSDDGAQAVQRDGQTSHRIAHHSFHLRFGLLVAVDEAILAADVTLAETSRAATGNVDGAETRDALEVRAPL